MADLTDEEEERIEPTPHIAAKIDKIAPLVANDGAIAKSEEKAQKARSELGNLYQKIEKDFHGNPKAVKLVRTLLGGTTDAAYDFMRTFMRLADHFQLIPADDLVDLAEKASKASPPETGDKGVSGADLAPVEDKVVPIKTKDNAIDRHLKALEGGDKPPAPKGPPGDNDLADAGSDVADEIAAQRAKDAQAFDESRVTH